MISILIAEDEKDYQRYLKKLIDKEPEFYLVECVETVAKIKKQLRERQVDVLLLDLILKNENALDHIAEFIALSPSTRVCVLSMLNDEDALVQSFRFGAKGYIVKGDRDELLVQEIRTLHLGGSPLTSSLAQKLIALLPVPQQGVSPLTDRQIEILHRLALGFQYKDIATDLNISPQTVRTHIRNIYNALEASSKREAIHRGRSLGLL